MSESLTYQSHAKLNLYLDVLERREDGFHNIETVFQTVSLCDTLTVTARDSGLQLDCDDPELGPEESNLVYRAANALLERSGSDRGALMDLHKEIPVASGLAGGSGNAAAALVALDALWELGLSDRDLADLALELGSDVPYCLHGGTMGARQRGDELFELAPMPETWFVLIHPPILVSAASVYTNPALKKSGAPGHGGLSTAFDVAVTAISNGDVAGALHNSMEEVVFEIHPDLAEIKSQLLEAGCLGALMSGSGPTIYGVCAGMEEAERISREFPHLRRSVAHSVDHGVVRLD